MTWRGEILGSARVSPVGDGVLAIVNFSRDCFGATPKPARETRTLPGNRNCAL